MNAVQKHVRILAVCLVVYSCLFAMIGVILGLWGIFFGGLLMGDRNAIPGGTFLIVLVLILSVPGVIAGIGMSKFRRWSRIAALVFLVLHLIVFPFGTVLGIYGLAVLLNPRAWPLFESAAPV